MYRPSTIRIELDIVGGSALVMILVGGGDIGTMVGTACSGFGAAYTDGL